MSNCTNAINSNDVFMQANVVLNENPNVISFADKHSNHIHSPQCFADSLTAVQNLPTVLRKKISRTIKISNPFVHPSTATVKEILLTAIAYNVAPVKMEKPLQ